MFQLCFHNNIFYITLTSGIFIQAINHDGFGSHLETVKLVAGVKGKLQITKPRKGNNIWKRKCLYDVFRVFIGCYPFKHIALPLDNYPVLTGRHAVPK